MIESNIMTAFTTSLTSIIMIDSRVHIHHFLENLGFSKKLILLLIVFSGFAILIIEIFLENSFLVVFSRSWLKKWKIKNFRQFLNRERLNDPGEF